MAERAAVMLACFANFLVEAKSGPGNPKSPGNGQVQSRFLEAAMDGVHDRSVHNAAADCVRGLGGLGPQGNKV